MKKSILALILILSLANTEEVSFLKQEDKQKHIGYTFALGAAGSMIAEEYGVTPIESFFWGLGTALAAGLAKEVYDSRDGGSGFNGNDMMANALGGALGGGAGTVLVRFNSGRWL